MPNSDSSTAAGKKPKELPYSGFGRFRPTIYWYTPFLILGSAALLIFVLWIVIRRLARAAEDKHWPDAEKRRRYQDPVTPPSGE